MAHKRKVYKKGDMKTCSNCKFALKSKCEIYSAIYDAKQIKTIEWSELKCDNWEAFSK